MTPGDNSGLVNGNEPATKGDFANLNPKFEQLRSEMSQPHQDLVTRMHESRTTLLNVFCGIAESTEERLNQIEANQAAIRVRLDSLGGRMFEVEKRLHIPLVA